MKDLLRGLVKPRVPRAVAARFRSADPGGMQAFGEMLKRYYRADQNSGTDSDEERLDLRGNFTRRLDSFRHTAIPWLIDARSLQGSRVLEIGCGAGSGTIALAEQGAAVTGVDIDADKLAIAGERCKVFGLQADFVHANAAEVHRIFSDRHFDLIIFFATLEHMTHEERMAAMKGTWEMLSPGALWCLVDTPNRLWFYDGHTSWLPFYHWLPDDLALLYSRFSPRKGFQTLFQKDGISEESRLLLRRRGRGLSYHEFTLAMQDAEKLDVVSSLPIFLRRRNILRTILWQLTNEHRYESLLAKVGPRIHRGFYQPSLELIIRKS